MYVAVNIGSEHFGECVLKMVYVAVNVESVHYRV